MQTRSSRYAILEAIGDEVEWKYGSAWLHSFVLSFLGIVGALPTSLIFLRRQG
jgi:hypothetical protein